MRKVNITKIGVGSLGKFVGVVQATIAFVIGLIATVAAASGIITGNSSFIKGLCLSVGVFAVGVVLYPIIAFIIGWIQGVIAAIILNFVFKESGGLELELEDRK